MSSIWGRIALYGQNVYTIIKDIFNVRWIIMQVVDNSISLTELQSMADRNFGRLVKAVVDISKEIMVIDAEMHSDQEEFLLEQGSNQADVWGINIHPFAVGDDWIEFDSMINVRPSWGNRSRFIEDPMIQKKVVDIVNRLVKKC